MTPNHEAYISAVASVWSAIGTVATAIIPASAAVTWRFVLKEQRKDECVAAINDWWGAVGRVLSQAENGQDIWIAFNQAWISWRDFRKTYAVLRRYHQNMPQELIETSFELSDRLKPLCENKPFDTTKVFELRTEIKTFVKRVERVIRFL